MGKGCCYKESSSSVWAEVGDRMIPILVGWLIAINVVGCILQGCVHFFCAVAAPGQKRKEGVSILVVAKRYFSELYLYLKSEFIQVG